MRIESASVELFGSSSSIEKNTKEESLKMLGGNTRPAFQGEKITSLFSVPDNAQSGDTLQLSAEGKAALEKHLAAASTRASSSDSEEETLDISDKDKQKILLLQEITEKLTGKRFKFVLPKAIKLDNHITGSQFVNARTIQPQAAPDQSHPLLVQLAHGEKVEYDFHETHYEKQSMSFSAEGTVKTADENEIKFNLDLNISREFASRTDLSIRGFVPANIDPFKVDPLVVNFDSPSAALTNNKFSFDIDNDGNSEQISFTTGGSGFLAFDVNNDGIVNNGSELFGPQSGNGFNELAKYDGDGNGWIDENDEIYSNLRIWSKDENGNDQLFALGEKGIGAIYLGNVSTAFDMKTVNNQTLGSIAKTGIYLKENGTAGTIQHVDLVI